MITNSGLVRVLKRKDVLALAFGAMVGWGWVILSSSWILKAGSMGAMLAFVIAGLVMLLVALLYAELASAMPRVGGEHVYSLRALGRAGSFVCTWSIVFVYVSICCFEAVALASVLDYFPLDLKHVHLWTVAGYDVYLSWALIGSVAGLILTVINIIGVKFSAVVQTVVTAFILVSGAVLISGAGIEGSFDRLDPLFVAGAAGTLSVVTMVPFFFVGFDVIPQVAEEVDLPFRQIGSLTVFSVCLAIVWYCLIIAGVALLADSALLRDSKLATADASALAWGKPGATIIVLGGIAGILTSWNAFIIGGSRAIFAMAESRMLPSFLSRLHGRFRTPYSAIILIGILGFIAPLFGRNALVWIVNAGSFGAVIAYLLVSISFLKLRYSEPDMSRPYRLSHGVPLGWVGVVCCIALGAVYLPGSPSALAPVEWMFVLAWILLGLCFLAWSALEE
ncbi:APC family permease [Elongatibacter sediminis]|uniref:Amino acid permease n=1 Tax=Elongatibacter sediminis TaxID=3119006 RepID=A0AAW9RBT1_9GAMM